MDSNIKKQCEALYSELGNKPYHGHQCIFTSISRAGGFPFEVRLEQPNQGGLLLPCLKQGESPMIPV